MDSKVLETEAYSHFLYNREIVFGVKYQVRVRILADDLVSLRRASPSLDVHNLWSFLASPIGQ